MHMEHSYKTYRTKIAIRSLNASKNEPIFSLNSHKTHTNTIDLTQTNMYSNNHNQQPVPPTEHRPFSEEVNVAPFHGAGLDERRPATETSSGIFQSPARATILSDPHPFSSNSATTEPESVPIAAVPAAAISAAAHEHCVRCQYDIIFSEFPRLLADIILSDPATASPLNCRHRGFLLVHCQCESKDSQGPLLSLPNIIYFFIAEGF